MAKPSGAPTSEIGAPAPFLAGGAGLQPWSAYMEDREYAPDVRWPQSIETYTRMQSDAQLKGLLLATTLPIRRFRWEIDPNGARPEVVKHVAGSLNLPIRGQDPPPVRRRKRFSWSKHLQHALRCLAFGHYYFEQVYDYSDPRKGGDGLLRLRKLGTRPPRTIANILQEDDGGLKAIEQAVGIASGQTLGSALQGRKLDVSRLLAYIWDSEDDGDWVGRSMLRPCFRHWLIKDRLLRVDATKHERNGMGVPWFEVDPAASNEQIEALAATAEAMRAGERAGGAGPGKLSLKGVEGSVPDTIGSVRYHDQQMSRAFLLLFFELGTSETGSRALGSEFIDWYTEGQDAIADTIRDTAQEHQVEDEVELNWGSDEQPPALVYTRLEGTELSMADLMLGVEKGAIALDDEMRSYIVQRWRLPKGAATPPPAPSPAPDPTPAPEPTPTPEPTATAPQRPARSELADRIVATVDRPMRWVDVAAALSIDPKGGTGRRARDQLVSAGTLVKRTDHAGATVLAPVAGIRLPDRDLRRQPLDFEVTASVDFAAMEETFTVRRASLVEAVKAAQADQIDALAAAVEDAGGDATKLASLEVDPVDASLIRDHLADVADEGEASARAEHEAQIGPSAARGRPTAVAADQDEIDERLEQRAQATAITLAAGLAVAASKRAVAVAALSPEDAAADVRNYLSGLSGAELELQLGGAVTGAYNAGRFGYMRANSPKTVYASELLDANTCTECTAVDGTEYSSVEAAEQVYPGGGYIYCEGGLRCRGTAVAVY